MPIPATQWVPPKNAPNHSIFIVSNNNAMRIYLGLFLSLTLVAIACGKSGSPSSPTGPTGPTGPTTPTITSITPDSGGYNTTVTITGTNFSTTMTSDIVTFNGVTATVTAAAATQLTVSVPVGAGTGVIKLTIGSNTITGPTFTYLYTYTVSTLSASSAGFNDPYGIAVDTAGNVIVADDGNNQIKMVTPAGVVSTIAGSGTPGFMNGAAATAEFLDPPAVAVDPLDNIFVGDAFNYKIREISSGTVSTFAGTTVGESNGGVSTAQFDSPTWMAIDGSENVFLCDAHYLREVSSGSVSTLYDGHTYSSTLVSFTGIALKPADTLVLLDDFGANVFQLTPSGTFSVLAGTGSLGYFDGPASTAQFSSATGIALDANNNILVADEANQRIRLISPAGIVSTIAGSGAIGDVDSTGTAAEFNYPHGIAVDKKSGNIYVLEPSTNRIRMITVK
jgi:serine/threonine protein kinase, bacterial